VPEPEKWVLTFVALDDPAPVAVRVRNLLKRALRSFTLRCVAISGSAEPDKPPANPAPPIPATVKPPSETRTTKVPVPRPTTPQK
jgi:hypothetical protein